MQATISQDQPATGIQGRAAGKTRITAVPPERFDRRTNPCRRLITLLIGLAFARQFVFAGCDGLGGSGGGCGPGGVDASSLLLFATNDVSAEVVGVNGLILTEVRIPERYRGLPVRGIGPNAFAGNFVTSVIIPSGVTNIAEGAFYDCDSLTQLTIPKTVTFIGDRAFADCYWLHRIQFEGKAPRLGGLNVFENTYSTIYVLPGASGWRSGFAGRPTAQWELPNPVILDSNPGFGVKNNAFGFRISWAANTPVVVEACTDLGIQDWSTVGTITLANGWSDFVDAEAADHPGRFYRLRAE